MDETINPDTSNIPISLSVEECIDKTLEPIRSVISQYSEYLIADKKIDYLKMRRFIFTAYNNLVEMDQSVLKAEVSEPKSKLNAVKKHFDELEMYLKKPLSINFEKIFLEQQSHYREVRRSAERAKHNIDLKDVQASHLRVTHSECKKSLQLTSRKHPRYPEIEARCKKLNREYVDSLHEASELRSRLALLQDRMEEFKKSHSITFGKVFDERTEQIKGDINSIMDGIAYEFDTILWEKAKESTAVRKFFLEAKIEGTYSSKTFLKYYMRSLDEQKFSEDQEKLYELLDYLESISAKHIFFLSNDDEELAHFRMLIENIDKDFTVYAESVPAKIYSELKRHPIDLLVLNDEQKSQTGIEILQELWNTFEEAKNTLPVMLRFQKPTYESLDTAGKMGVKYFILAEASDEEFKEKLLDIL